MSRFLERGIIPRLLTAVIMDVLQAIFLSVLFSMLVFKDLLPMEFMDKYCIIEVFIFNLATNYTISGVRGKEYLQTGAITLASYAFLLCLTAGAFYGNFPDISILWRQLTAAFAGTAAGTFIQIRQKFSHRKKKIR